MVLLETFRHLRWFASLDCTWSPSCVGVLPHIFLTGVPTKTGAHIVISETTCLEDSIQTCTYQAQLLYIDIPCTYQCGDNLENETSYSHLCARHPIQQWPGTVLRQIGQLLQDALPDRFQLSGCQTVFIYGQLIQCVNVRPKAANRFWFWSPGVPKSTCSFRIIGDCTVLLGNFFPADFHYVQPIPFDE